MGQTVRFPGRHDNLPTPPSGPQSGTLANKLQVLLLRRPIAAHEVEKLIDQLLIEPEK